MGMQQFTVRKISLMFMIFAVVLPIVLPIPVHAEDNVFFCMENKDKCTEDGMPISDKDTAEDKDGTTDTDSKKEAKVGVSAWDYIRTIFALAFVVGILFVLLKFVNRKNRMYDKNRFMKNMGGISLGQHKSVQLVAVGDTYYLIGVGEDIRLLKEITDDEEITALIEHYDEVDASSAAGWLEQILSRVSKVKSPSNQPEDNTADFSRVFNSRLDEIKEERKRHISQLTEKERGKDE